MNKSVFSNNIEAKADNLEEGDGLWDYFIDWWNRKDWNRNRIACTGTNRDSFTISYGDWEITYEHETEIEEGGYKWMCERTANGQGMLAHCRETRCR